MMEGETLERSVEQLVRSVKKHIEEGGSFEQAEERMKHLEEYEEDFHKYELVRNLKETIEKTLGPQIDDEIETFSVSGNDFISDQETLVSRVTEKVLGSGNFKILDHQIKSNMEAAVEHLIETFEPATTLAPTASSGVIAQGQIMNGANGQESMGVEGRGQLVLPVVTGAGGRGHHGNENFFLSEDEDSVGSSFNHGQFGYLTADSLKTIARALDKQNSLETRRQGLEQLNRTSLNESFTGNDELLQMTQRGLVDALMSSDREFSSNTLKFIAKYTKRVGELRFSSISRELYGTLITYIGEKFATEKGHLPKVKGGLDTKHPDTLHLLRAFRLMNEIQRNAANYWLRYQIRFMEDLFSCTLQLLSMTNHTLPGSHMTGSMTPVHFLCLLDPRADWFNKWTHGNYSRAPLLRMLHQNLELVQGAVNTILDFVSTKRAPVDVFSDSSESMSGSYRGSHGFSQRTTYSGPELSYIYFVHSLSMVGRLLSFTQGREFFPIKVKGRHGGDNMVTLSSLICSLIQLISEPGGHGLPVRNLAAKYEPANLVSEVLKKLGSSEQSCSACLCDTDVIGRLIQPITSWLEGSYSSVGQQASDATYLHIADILSIIASRSEGRKHLLYGTGERLTRSRSSAAHSITMFTIQALKKTPPRGSAVPSNGVTAAFLYLCRQLYGTAEGLHALYPYNLHQTITDSWRGACRAVEMARTPTPGGGGHGNRGDSPNPLIAWEDTLKDNLLSLSGTPKGCLLIQLSGAMEDCILYMNSRYREKQQVSRLEKFGYGTMITQLASTAPGISALSNNGFIDLFVKSVWDALENGLVEPGKTERQILYHPTDPLDKCAQKPFCNLLNVLSSYSSVVELLDKVPLPTQPEYTLREKPSNVQGLIDRLLMVDAEDPLPKIHSLFNYEQSHTFGLRMLSVVMSCLDAFLLMETQYHVLDSLLALQRMEDRSESGDIIVDMLSVERNYVLVKGYMVGGPSERILPPRSLEVETRTGEFYPFPIFSSYPVPKDFMVNLAGKPAMKQENDLSSFLSKSKMEPHDESWAEGCKTAFIKVMTSKPEHIRGTVIQDLLEGMVQYLSEGGPGTTKEVVFPELSIDNESSAKQWKLSSSDELGVQLTVRYGIQLKLLSPSKEVKDRENLNRLLKNCGYSLSLQQRDGGGDNSNLKTLRGRRKGFDWLSASVFLLMKGNKDKSWTFQQKLSSLLLSAYIWPSRLHKSNNLPPHLALCGISPLFSSVCHWIELILQVTDPLIHSAFKMSGFTAAEICQHWLKQCFWCYMDWADISHYLCLVLVMGVDYQVYLCIAILKSLSRDIFYHQQRQTLMVFLKEEPLHGFHIGPHLECMKDLERKFRKPLMADLYNLTKP